MIGPKYYDKIANELFDKHSLAALVICIDIGEELDFHYNEKQYAITWLKGKLILSGREVEEIQEFKDCFDLITTGMIDGKLFMDTWDELVLDFLY